MDRPKVFSAFAAEACIPTEFHTIVGSVDTNDGRQIAGIVQISSQCLWNLLSGARMTLLDEFIAREHIKPRQLARVAYVSRQHLMRLRTGTADPTRHVMVRLMMACTLILHRRVRLDELFDLTDAGV